MNIQNATILKNECIAKDTYRMVLEPDDMVAMLPGQFVNIKLDGFMLRRPISICSIDADTYTLLYKIVGDGTLRMSQLHEGDVLDVFEGLGNPFPIFEQEETILIIGGGIGVPPLYEVAKQYRLLDKKVNVVLGFNDASYVILENEFSELGCNVYIATMDGSYGATGTVMDAIKHFNVEEGLVYSCGALGMLKAVDLAYSKGYLSFESRMACGMGACMGCVCKDKEDKDLYYRICKEGPVFELGKVDF